MSEGEVADGRLEAFTDTSVLFNYALDLDRQRADVFLVEHRCIVVASETVRREFAAVMERRVEIHTQLLPYAKRDAIEEFEPADSERLTSNDWGYFREFRSVLATIEPTEAARRIQERNRQLKQGYRELFELDPPLVVVTTTPARDARLLGTLSGTIENDADARIVCDAVEWTRDGGSGILVTSDVSDMIGDDGRESRPEAGGELPDTFEGLLSSDSRPPVDRINEAIERRYDETCRLEIHSIDSFLERY